MEGLLVALCTPICSGVRPRPQNPGWMSSLTDRWVPPIVHSDDLTSAKPWTAESCVWGKKKESLCSPFQTHHISPTCSTLYYRTKRLNNNHYIMQKWFHISGIVGQSNCDWPLNSVATPPSPPPDESAIDQLDTQTTQVRKKQVSD